MSGRRSNARPAAGTTTEAPWSPPMASSAIRTGRDMALGGRHLEDGGAELQIQHTSAGSRLDGRTIASRPHPATPFEIARINGLSQCFPSRSALRRLNAAKGDNSGCSRLSYENETPGLRG